jgi:hypothetical protein
MTKTGYIWVAIAVLATVAAANIGHVFAMH